MPKSKAIQVGSLVYFYNGWMWSNGRVKEIVIVNRSNAHKYPISFSGGHRAYSIVSQFNGHYYSPISRKDISRVIE